MVPILGGSHEAPGEIEIAPAMFGVGPTGTIARPYTEATTPALLC